MKEIDVLNNFEIYKKLMFLKEVEKERPLIFLCVGNSKIWFDSFGPIFGSLLKILNFKYYIYGNMKSNITAKNINQYIDIIYMFHNNPFIIVVDNALSNTKEPMLNLNKGPINCAVLNNGGVPVGDFSITYCLNKKNLKNNNNYYFMLNELKKVVRFLRYLLVEKY